jgi:hypothetical protein
MEKIIKSRLQFAKMRGNSFITTWEADLSCGHTVIFELNNKSKRPTEITCGICNGDNYEGR